ncbi:2,3-bisphosphoglycerate-independent phosphoglycerate mutase [Adlercreutzia equolifaciens]|uniref:2,3-bisphosphoglycerate-independent phosphoglycerate mutase n=1 Tax=Adlercreutzia equolifaciens TaxID=446660 RepID=UPI0023AF9AA5|nr:2,3-bisphosphoglycerate-independent phosphoglycerate mutase [Adlercreutzia equolifaciens]MDE8703133.1 2,3-bisphosphoglycerate-independent phosphoglycerate mutase [Adlercreutzia equolifaciens]
MEQVTSSTMGAAVDRSKLRLPACLIIMDGFGLQAPGPGNAISLANTPVLDRLFSEESMVQLQASGEAVGLPEGQMGNSEVGHLNIGAGRVVFQELTRINRACRDGSLATNPVLQEAFAAACQPQAALHLMGLVSDGGVHSSNEHLYGLVDAAVAAGVKHVMIHCFMDGRDVPPSSGAEYLRELVDYIERAQSAAEPGTVIEIASVEGRYYAMDRDNRWERVERAYQAVANAEPYRDVAAVAAVESSYTEGVTDEFIEPVALSPRGMRDGDAVVFFNFRPDRAREITRALVDPNFTGFERSQWPAVHFVCLTEYDPSIPAPVAFPKEFPSNVLADVLADAGLTQYHIAETEKYAHVTFFLNGGIEEMKAGETRKLIASPKVATYDLQPEMSEPEVAATLAAAIDRDEADVYIVNFANCDMVGHTGYVDAAQAAVEAVDAGVGLVLDAVARKGGVALVTADHGNADCMIAEDGGPFTAHTTAPVPLVLVDYTGTAMALDGREGRLADIAPTLLAMIGLAAPQEMTGENLLA